MGREQFLAENMPRRHNKVADLVRAVVGVASFVTALGMSYLVANEALANQGEVNPTPALIIGGVAVAGICQSIQPIARLSGLQR